MRQAAILVGGRGTRLGDLARDTPKPLLEIAGKRRFLDVLLDNLARHGVEDIVLLAGHLAEVAVREYDGASVRGARVSVIAEPEPCGTAGALRNAAARLDEAFFLLNGDSYFDVNYLALGDVLRGKDVAAVALRRVPDGARYGRVDLAGDRITGFHEKDESRGGEALVSAGVYLLRRAVLDFIDRTPCSIETEVFPALVSRGLIAGIESGGFFIDVGLPETLAQARATLVDEARRPAVLFDRDGTLIIDEGYTFEIEKLAWQPGAIEAVRAVNDAGALAVVVTNQSGVARGLYTEDAVRLFHEHMQAQLIPHGAHIDAFYHCPYHGAGVIDEFALPDHPDRKPNPGMLRRALTEWPIDAGRCFLVGDAEQDASAAEALGLPGFLVRPGELKDAVARELLRMPPKAPALASAAGALKQRAAAARSWLFNHALPIWWERGYDRNSACFHERLALDGEPLADLPRRVRVQARQTAVYARAGRLGWDGPWRDAVDAGVSVLLGRAIRADGGVRHLLSPAGEPSDERRDLYDLAFVTFALAEAACALGDRPDLVAAAGGLFVWAELNWADAQGGFREGDITPTPPRRQNPHMHMFEALLALYEASGEPAWLARAGAIASLFGERLFDERHGALPEYFDDSWRPLRGEEGAVAEPGHHFEWSWLLHRWNALGGGDLSALAERLRVHAEVYGVELASGAVYDEVFLDGRARLKTSRLWPHTERIKANLARFERVRDIAAARAAVQAFDKLMAYCNTPTPGLWRDRRKQGGGFVDEAAPASSFYHAMLAISELIRVADALD